MKQSFTTYIDSSRERGLCTVDYVKYLNFNSGIQNFKSLSKSKVIIEKSRGEGSLMEQDTIENVS